MFRRNRDSEQMLESVQGIWRERKRQMSEQSVTAEERQEFLNRQGWKKASPQERERLEEIWTDAKIHMAVELNLA